PKTDMGGWSFVANAKGKDPETAAKFCAWALGSMSDDSIQRVVDWCIKAKADIAPRRSALQKATDEGGYSRGPMKTFKEEIFPTGRAEGPEPLPECDRDAEYRRKADTNRCCRAHRAPPGNRVPDSELRATPRSTES